MGCLFVELSKKTSIIVYIILILVIPLNSAQAQKITRNKRWVVEDFTSWSMTGIPLNKLNETLLSVSSKLPCDIKWDYIPDSLVCDNDIIEIYLRLDASGNQGTLDYSLKIASNCLGKQFIVSHITNSKEIDIKTFAYNKPYSIYNLKDEYIAKSNKSKKTCVEGFVLKVDVENGYIHLIDGIIFY